MKLGAVHFSHLSDAQLEDLYGVSRAMSRDARGCGCYGLSVLLKAFTVECVSELSRRAVEDTANEQLTIA